MQEQNDRCKCCLRERPTKDLWSEHFYHGDTENYGKMISSCFQLSWKESQSETERICHPCIGRLRDAVLFKNQIVEAQKYMMEILDDNGEIAEEKVQEFLEKHLNITGPHKPKDTSFIVESDDDDEDSNDDDGSEDDYTEIEYLEVDNSDLPKKSAVTTMIENVDSSDDNDPIKKVEVLLGDTVIKKIIKVGTKSSNRIPKISQKPSKRDLMPIVTLTSDGIVSTVERPKPVSQKPAKKKGPVRPEDNRNLQFKIERSKHQDNLVALLLWTNATPILSKQDNGFECGFCNNFFLDPADLKTHTIEHHTEGEKRKYMTDRELSSYVAKLDITDLCCNRCSEPLQDVNAGLKHLGEQHGVQVHLELKNHIIPFKFVDKSLFSCFVCGTIFEFFRALTNHMNVHLNNYVCETCGRGFLTNRAMRMHSRLHTSGTFPCNYCPKVFSARQRWLMHENLAHKSRHKRYNIVCGFCGQRFKESDHKSKHLELEHGVKRPVFQCDQCNKILSCKKSLVNHIENVHYAVKRFECSECPKKFFCKTSMDRHFANRHNSNKKRMQCTYCPKVFTREASLRLHIRAHTGDRHHVCELCSETFLMKSGLLSHLRGKHNVGLPEVSVTES